MIELFVKVGCPFCAKVLAKLNELKIPFKEKDIYKEEANLRELLKLGGKQQVPYLVDTELDVNMYESDDIVAYLQEHYENKKLP